MQILITPAQRRRAYFPPDELRDMLDHRFDDEVVLDRLGGRAPEG